MSKSYNLRDLLVYLRNGEVIPDFVPQAGRSDVTTEDLNNALAVSGSLLALKHRNRIVESLYRTAVDLTSINDVNEVLQSLVQRTRDLMMTDVAYITLVDPDIGGSRVQASAGTTSPAFDVLALERGVGLGGRVLKTGAPVMTPDYLKETAFTRAERNDETVAVERLRSILGVPMRAGDQVLGVLFVANRSTHTFSDPEVSLLQSLAAHAALAVRNAQNYQELEETASQIHLMQKTLSEQAEGIATEFEAHIGLSEAVLRPEPLDRIVRSAATLMGGGLLVLGQSGAVRAQHAREDERDLLEALTDLAAFDALDSVDFVCLGEGQLGKPEGVEGCTGYVAPLVARGEILGYAYAVLARRTSFELERSVRRIFLVLSEALLGEKLDRQHSQSSLSQFLDYVSRIDGASERTVTQVAERFGITLYGLGYICVWSSDSMADQEGQAVLAALQHRGVQAARHDGSVVALIPRDMDPSEVHSEIVSFAWELVCGVGELGSQRWSEALSHAKSSAKSLLLLERRGEIASRQELEVLGVLVSELSPRTISVFLDRELGDLQQHDRENGTKLVETVSQWFLNNRNRSKTASALSVHVNTLYRRISQVRQMLGPGWDHGDRALDLQLALRLSRITAGLSGSEL